MSGDLPKYTPPDQVEDTLTAMQTKDEREMRVLNQELIRLRGLMAQEVSAKGLNETNNADLIKVRNELRPKLLKFLDWYSRKAAEQRREDRSAEMCELHKANIRALDNDLTINADGIEITRKELLRYFEQLVIPNKDNRVDPKDLEALNVIMVSEAEDGKVNCMRVQTEMTEFDVHVNWFCTSDSERMFKIKVFNRDDAFTDFTFTIPADDLSFGVFERISRHCEKIKDLDAREEEGNVTVARISMAAVDLRQVENAPIKQEPVAIPIIHPTVKGFYLLDDADVVRG